MRIAYVCAANAPVFGRKGEAAHVQGVVRALARTGARVDLFATRLGGDLPPDLGAAAIHQLERPRGRGRRLREQSMLRANDDLREQLEALGPVDLVYERYSLWSFAAMEHARATGARAVLEVNGARIEEAAALGQLIDRDGAESAAERSLGAASAIIAVSEGVAHHLRERFQVDGRVHVVPNGVDAARYTDEIVCARERAERPFTVGYVGGMRRYHGVETLVEAFAQLSGRRPDARLRLVGQGPALEGVEAMVADLGLAERTHVEPGVDPDRVPAELALLDVGVAPYAVSHASYASPLKVLEYLASGMPAVACGVEQLDELIEPGQTGFLFESGDAQGLAELLDRLAGDPELRARVGRAGRELVLARYTWDGVARRILELAARAPETAHPEGIGSIAT